jgi:hypothetical protein
MLRKSKVVDEATFPLAEVILHIERALSKAGTRANDEGLPQHHMPKLREITEALVGPIVVLFDEEILTKQQMVLIFLTATLMLARREKATEEVA